MCALVQEEAPDEHTRLFQGALEDGYKIARRRWHLCILYRHTRDSPSVQAGIGRSLYVYKFAPCARQKERKKKLTRKTSLFINIYTIDRGVDGIVLYFI